MSRGSEDQCPSCLVPLAYEKNGKTYSRAIGVEIWGVYDGVLYWECPNCAHRWHRFKPGAIQYVRAQEYVRDNASDR